MKEQVPKKIDSVLDALIEQLGIRQKLDQYGIIPLWPEIVGAQIAKVTEVERIDNGVLVIHVTNAPWRNELTFRRKEILAKIHQRMNGDVIKDIRFR
ncbi:MAG: DciA family protein [Acidobacteriota bacterium]